MRELFLTYGITLGRRNSRKQKIMYINEFSKPLLDENIKVELQEKKRYTKTVTNVQIGDLDKASTIVVAGYDTASKMLVPGYKYKPIESRKNLFMEYMNMLVSLIISCGIFFVGYLITRNLGTYSVLVRVLVVLVDLVILFVAFILLSGIPNGVNYNKNSAANILIHTLALKTKNNPKVAYVLTDFSADTYIGYKQLRDWLGDEAENKKIVVLDSISSGENMYAVAGKNMAGDAGWFEGNKKVPFESRIVEEKIANTVLAYFPKMMVICSGDENNGVISSENVRTAKDYKVDLNRMEALTELLLQYVKR